MEYSLTQNQKDSRNSDSRVFTVTEITRFIKIHLESKFPAVTITGEISNFTRQSSGHVYFTLKDRHASISCVLFRSNAARVKFPLESGLQIVAKGGIRVYEPRGSYQLNVTSIEPAGKGNLHLEFERLKLKFKEMGYFDQERKKDLPFFPRKIGIVTSPTGAVIQDMKRVINRRCPGGVELYLVPVKVQGYGAGSEIVSAIQELNRSSDIEVIIVGRGGGSLEDLWAFNEEEVVQAIYQSEVPVVSAVGHETDFTLSDFVADVRAATPSVAGELVVPELEAVQNYLDDRKVQLLDRFKACVERLGSRLKLSDGATLARFLENYLERFHQDLDYIRESFQHRLDLIFQFKSDQIEPFGPLQKLLEKALVRMLDQRKMQLQSANLRRLGPLYLEKLARSKYHVDDLDHALHGKIQSSLADKVGRMELLIERLKLTDPDCILEKGYAYLKKNEKIISDANDLSVGEKLEVVLAQDLLEVEVLSKKERDESKST